MNNLEENQENKIEENKELKIENNQIESNKQEMKTKTISKKIIAIIILSVIVVLALLFSVIFALVNINNSNIISGIKIEGIEVSGLSKQEAEEKLKLIYDEKKKQDIILKYEDYEPAINPEQLETNYDIDSAVNEAISVGKQSNIFVNNYNILLSLIGKKDIKVNMTINEEIANKTIEDIGKNLPGVVEESDYYIEGENLIITKGKEGIQIKAEELLDKIKSKFSNIKNEENYIDIPIINKNPEEIDIQKIHDEIYKEVKDAFYTKEPFTIHAEVEGVDFNVEEAKAILEAEDKNEYIIKLNITKPKVTTADIGSEAFPDLLATFTTRYDASNIDRTTNLRLACQKINEKVVLPGATFSYNQALGERTKAAGYKNAKVYENGEVVDGIGGGICQISSTLYNTVLMSNLEITERRNHQFVTSYVSAGRDATVVYGQIDFKFKNPRKYAIKIKANISNGIATVSIYGLKEEEEYSVSFDTRTISSIPFTVKYVEDSSINVGTEKVKQKGANGAITETYIIKSLNGKVVSRKLLSKDTYSAMQKIIIKGTKGAQNNNANINNNGNNSNNNNNSDKNTNINNEINNEAKNETKPNNGNKIENNTIKGNNI